MSSKLLRASILKRLRSFAKAEPEALKSRSEKLCDKLYTHIMSEYCQPVTSSHGTDKQLSKSLFVLSYLPLYYEVDLRPLMRRLWHFNTKKDNICCSNSSNSNSHTSHMCKEKCSTNSLCIESEEQSTNVCEQFIPSICVMVPVVLDPTTWSTTSATTNHTSLSTSSSIITETASEWPNWLPRVENYGESSTAERLRGAMMFVEVFDEADLQNSFVEYGKFHIVELKRELLNNFFVPRKGNIAQDEWSAEQTLCKQKQCAGEIRRSHSGHDNTPGKDLRVRRTLFSRSFTELFPDYFPPVGEIHWEHVSNVANANTPSANVSSSAMLLLAPGVYFDRNTGARVGKGGGYYDRFIHYHRSCSARKDWCLRINKEHISINNENKDECCKESKPCENAMEECKSQEICLESLSTLTAQNVSSAADHVTFDVIGIGFDEQVNRGVNSESCVQMQAHDECVNHIATPTYGVEKAHT